MFPLAPCADILPATKAKEANFLSLAEPWADEPARYLSATKILR